MGVKEALEIARKRATINCGHPNEILVTHYDLLDFAEALARSSETKQAHPIVESRPDDLCTIRYEFNGIKLYAESELQQKVGEVEINMAMENQIRTQKEVDRVVEPLARAWVGEYIKETVGNTKESILLECMQEVLKRGGKI